MLSDYLQFFTNFHSLSLPLSQFIWMFCTRWIQNECTFTKNTQVYQSEHSISCFCIQLNVGRNGFANHCILCVFIYVTTTTSSGLFSVLNWNHEHFADFLPYTHLLTCKSLCSSTKVTLNTAVQHRMSARSPRGAERLVRHAASPSASKWAC